MDDLLNIHLHSLPGLARLLGFAPDKLLVLRDDLLPLAGGGNKVRKGFISVARALDHGAAAIITSGAPQSNHVRAIAGLGARAGLDVHLVLAGAKPSSVNGNVLLDELFGATVTWAGTNDLEHATKERAAIMRAMGTKVEVIPFGGSSPETVAAYRHVGKTLLKRRRDLQHVVVAAGSGATMAGLVSGLGADRVLGIDCGAVPDIRSTIMELLTSLAPAVRASHLRVDTLQVGSGYSQLQPQVARAVQLLARTDGVILDPTYTGRAAAGLLAAVASKAIGPAETTVLLHTGGVPGLFGHPEAACLVDDA